jgi:hypothetical protein
MYLPNKIKVEKLKNLYEKINWDLEYDKLYFKNKLLKEKSNINLKEESINEFLIVLLKKYKLHIKKGGTKFGFIFYLKENKILFKCSTCQNLYSIEDISIGFQENKINVGACTKCNSENSKKWRENKNGKEWMNNYISERRNNDDIFRFKSNVRTLINSSFKRNKSNNWKKKTKTENILGCKFDFFRNYIEKKFTKGMTFENYGKWHLDHIKPLALAKNQEDVIMLNHYTNFQPLWASDNFKKGSRYY